MKQRIEFIDGHRGLAILMVILFHAYTRWSSVVPYGDEYADIFNTCFLGVQLFFLISGFVIFMTLEKCTGFKEFLFRRWLRLFPAMFFCSIIIFSTVSFFYERPIAQPNILSLLPGLLFVEPGWLKFILNTPITPLEGTFWSIYVEFKFYLISGYLYYKIGYRKLLIALFCLSVVGFLFQWVGQFKTHNLYLLSRLGNTLSLQYYGWFAAGATAYLFTQTNKIYWFILACILAIYSSIFLQVGLGEYKLSVLLTAIIVSAFFLISIINISVQKFLCNKVFLFFGLISYPLYLSHEGAMISMIIKIGKVFRLIPDFTYPFFPILVLCIFALICVKYVEPNLKKVLLKFLSSTKKC